MRVLKSKSIQFIMEDNSCVKNEEVVMGDIITTIDAAKIKEDMNSRYCIDFDKSLISSNIVFINSMSNELIEMKMQYNYEGSTPIMFNTLQISDVWSDTLFVYIYIDKSESADFIVISNSFNEGCSIKLEDKHLPLHFMKGKDLNGNDVLEVMTHDMFKTLKESKDE